MERNDIQVDYEAVERQERLHLRRRLVNNEELFSFSTCEGLPSRGRAE
jgi:hypothetical protein